MKIPVGLKLSTQLYDFKYKNTLRKLDIPPIIPPNANEQSYTRYIRTFSRVFPVQPTSFALTWNGRFLSLNPGIDF